MRGVPPRIRVKVVNKFKVTIAVFGALLGISVLRSLRRSHIRVEYSSAWIASAAAIIAVAIWPRLLRSAASILEIGEESAFLLFGMIVFSFLIYRVSLVVSRLKDDNTVLVQRMAMLEYELKNVSRGNAVSSGERR